MSFVCEVNVSCSQSADEPDSFLPDQLDLLLIITAALPHSSLFLNHSTDLLKDGLTWLYLKGLQILTPHKDQIITIMSEYWRQMPIFLLKHAGTLNGFP